MDEPSNPIMPHPTTTPTSPPPPDSPPSHSSTPIQPQPDTHPFHSSTPIPTSAQTQLPTQIVDSHTLIPINNLSQTMPTHPMVTRAKAGIFKPLERMNCHLTTTSPLPRSHVHALHDPSWKEAMLDEYNALITNRTWVLVPRPANVNVDDIILTALSLAFLQRIITSLHSEFAMTDLEEILERAHMKNCNPCRTPVDTESKLDLSYVVQQVYLYMHDPRNPHFTALKRILRYVRGTLDYGLQLHVSSTTPLSAYTDFVWAGFPVTHRSRSGYCVFLGGNLLSWSVKRQVTLSRSSAEAEYRGFANVVDETA
nr:ribonuclease H-like domain-containing protein [Tanacetum cinerariifolium]